MFKKIVIANWKMQLGVNDSLKLTQALKRKIKPVKGDVVICPDFSALLLAGQVIKGSVLKLGAQNVAAFDRGAYTGEVSPLNLVELGCKYVIIGHSERRSIARESNGILLEKINNVLKTNKLIPIFCISTLKQLEILKKVKVKEREIIVAYEPLWAIGTGKVITPIKALKMHAAVRQALVKIYGSKVGLENFRVVYGGSVDEKNAKNFAGLTNVDGLLVGGASLRADSFIKICSEILR